MVPHGADVVCLRARTEASEIELVVRRHKLVSLAIRGRKGAYYGTFFAVARLWHGQEPRKKRKINCAIAFELIKTLYESSEFQINHVVFFL